MVRKVRTAIGVSALALSGVLAGMLSAEAFGEVSLPVTVSLPTVSLPIPTSPPAPPPVAPTPPPPPVSLPPPPPVSVPTPPAQIPLPVSRSSPSSSPSPAPLPSSSSPATGGSSSSAAEPTSGDYSSGTYSPTSSERPRRPAARSRAARVTGIRARPGRVKRTRGQRRRAARITFTLSAPGRVVFVVRGPAPSCGVAGRFSVRGKRGRNRVGFTGRLGRRTLGPGAYRITARTRAGTAARPVVVLIDPTGAERSFVCGRSSNGASELFASLVGSFTSGGDGSSGTVTPTAEGSSNTTPATGTEEKPDSGVLPAVGDGLRKIPEALPKLQTPGSSSSPSGILGAGALVLLALSSLALLLYVIRFLRRADTI
jgi:hypothetical protein